MSSLIPDHGRTVRVFTIESADVVQFGLEM